MAFVHFAALKNPNSILQSTLNEMKYDALLLLTGTPIQNDVSELFALLQRINPEKFSSFPAFLAHHGNLNTTEAVEALQRTLSYIMLRRQKEDVEKSIPPKEETLINVELTRLQKTYYRAVYERNRTFLSRGGTGTTGGGTIGSLINIEMELRKCCNHPFLLQVCCYVTCVDGYCLLATFYHMTSSHRTLDTSHYSGSRRARDC